MNTRLNLFPWVIVSGLVLAGMSGCQILPEAQSDPTKYYVLSTAQAGVAGQAGAPVVHLR
jgi:hypothetical protein